MTRLEPNSVPSPFILPCTPALYVLHRLLRLLKRSKPKIGRKTVKRHRHSSAVYVRMNIISSPSNPILES